MNTTVVAMATVAPVELTVDDIDWPDWMLVAPVPVDIVVGQIEPPENPDVDPDERKAQMLAMAKEEPEVWAILRPYLKE